MEDMFYYNDLYDIYSRLLTDKQKKYYEDYYFNNLSLGEMAVNYKVSRNAIFKQLRIVVSKLLEYEEKLGFYNKIHQLDSILAEYGDDKLKKDICDIF